jgi:hypothetical protein
LIHTCVRVALEAAVASRTSAANVFPKKQTRQRQKGSPKPLWAFRPPIAVQEYIEAAETGGYDRTEVIIRMLEVAKDAADALGVDWFEIERLANVEGVTPGVVLARLARSGLDKRLKK